MDFEERSSADAIAKWPTRESSGGTHAAVHVETAGVGTEGVGAAGGGTAEVGVAVVSPAGISLPGITPTGGTAATVGCSGEERLSVFLSGLAVGSGGFAADLEV